MVTWEHWPVQRGGLVPSCCVNTVVRLVGAHRKVFPMSLTFIHSPKSNHRILFFLLTNEKINQE